MPTGDPPAWTIGYYQYFPSTGGTCIDNITWSPAIWPTTTYPVVQNPTPIINIVTNPAEPERRNMMTLYEVYIIDTKECKVLDVQNVIGKSEQDAAMEVELDDEMRALRGKDRLAIIYKTVGSFEKHSPKVEVVPKDE